MYSKKDKIAFFILRLGIAFSFIYAAISGFMSPQAWIGFFPVFLQEYIPASTLIILWGVIEIVLAGWIVFSRKIFLPSLFASIFLAILIFFNWSARDIIFRDITILTTTLALTITSFKRSV